MRAEKTEEAAHKLPVIERERARDLEIAGSPADADCSCWVGRDLHGREVGSRSLHDLAYPSPQFQAPRSAHLGIVQG